MQQASGNEIREPIYVMATFECRMLLEDPHGHTKNPYIFPNSEQKSSVCTCAYACLWQSENHKSQFAKKNTSRFQSPNKYFKCFQMQMGAKNINTDDSFFSFPLFLSRIRTRTHFFLYHSPTFANGIHAADRMK